MSSIENQMSDAIESNNLQQVVDLVSRGFDVNMRIDEDNGTALIFAAMYGRLEIVKYLVEQGADVNATAISDFALSSAAIEKHLEVYDYLYPLTAPELRCIAEEELREPRYSSYD